MRILVAIPHYFRTGAAPAGYNRHHASFGADSARRATWLARSITALHQVFGRPQCIIDIARRTTQPANTLTAQLVDVVVCTAGGDHLLAQLKLQDGYFEH